ncbi:MAG TPA: M28 family peptidase [Gemmatimonadales bacterium]|nr:M28 family peptidase [Gemmatimonadales bacterium]
MQRLSKPPTSRAARIVACCMTAIFGAACPTGVYTPPAPPAAPAAAPPLVVDTAAMDAHLKYLADDLLEGRAPATRGGELAARYIATTFQALGLTGAGSDGSYYQPVSLVGLTPRPTFVWGGRGATALRYLDDFVAWAQRPDSNIVADGDVVFVGYGIAAPEWQWDDYKDMDVRGKVLLMLVNDPGLQDSTVFNGKALAYYGRWTYKLEEATRRGAVGVVMIHTAASATYPWEVVRSSWSVEQFMIEGDAAGDLAFGSWVTEDAARRALGARRLNLDSLTAAAARRDFKPVATGIHVAVTVSSALRHVRSSNVVAKLTGSDTALAREVVVLTAHYDHKGIGPAVNGDSIYNGAEDNASGVAALLGAAEALVRAPRPKRSLLFIATTAEESGLLGSQAYVSAPLVPLARTAAALNIDVANVHGATRDIASLGMERSSLGQAFAAAARAESLTATGDPDPTKGSFFRSDHFPFARAGVPSLSIETGVNFVGRPASWGREEADRYTEQRYHQPSDEYSAAFTYQGMAQQVRVMVRLAVAVANAPALPSWLPSSEFQRGRTAP